MDKSLEWRISMSMKNDDPAVQIYRQEMHCHCKVEVFMKGLSEGYILDTLDIAPDIGKRCVEP